MYSITVGFNVYEWNGSHTVNVLGGRGEDIDCFSLDYANPSPDLVDFAQAVMNYEEEKRG